MTTKEAIERLESIKLESERLANDWVGVRIGKGRREAIAHAIEILRRVDDEANRGKDVGR